MSKFLSEITSGVHGQKAKAAYFMAFGAHKGQMRKYTNEHYINHPLAVAEIVSRTVTDNFDHAIAVSSALLHDVVEDTKVTRDDIWNYFGALVGETVDWLTDISIPEDGNRKIRKKIDREHIAKASPLAKTIKLADLIDNSRSIVERDPNFAKVYMEEKRLLLEVLHHGDKQLLVEAYKIVEDYFNKFKVQ